MTAWLPHIESISRFIVAIILNSIWEDAILVFAVWLLLRFLRNTNASTRYFSWLVTMVAAVLLPVLTTLPQTTFISTGSQQTISSNVASTTVARPRQHAAAKLKTTAPQTAAQAPSFRAPERLRLLFPSWLATVLFGVWLLSALIIGVRLAIDLISLERLKRDSLPLPVEFRDQMERWVKAAYGNAREVRICVSGSIEVPVAVGLFDSMILLPQHLLQELSAGELDRISLHELAHLHRGDDWTNSVQRFAQTLFFFNPAIRFVGSQLDLEREVACDDWVLSLTGDVRPYATCLTRMAELTSWPHRPLAAPGVFVTRKGISIRIERLLNKHRNARVNISYGVPGVVALALVGFFVLANVVTPVIAYTTE
ncbi:MAG: M56 family metallopeptidase, partial [Candidatus Eremiobacteraeota bacterium]|nr:M56 family metallopeptidase [Candidatus Eremiobacteraeota bacterium]